MISECIEQAINTRLAIAKQNKNTAEESLMFALLQMSNELKQYKEKYGEMMKKEQ